MLGVKNGAFAIFPHGSEKPSFTVSLTFDGTEGKNDGYTCFLDTEKIAIGLYRCVLSFDTPFGKVYATGGNIFRFQRERTAVFQLTLSRYTHKEPVWLYGGTIYHVFVDRFFRGGNAPLKAGAAWIADWENGIPEYPPYPGAPLANNTFFGGDLYGVSQKLPYIASLGARAIYLSPIFRAASNHKYDTGDYMTVDSMFGGEEALKDLLIKAKEKGIGIILDGVFNHTGSDSIYFNREGNYSTVGAYQSPKSKYYSWYDFQNYPDKYTC
ncbi:MAG: hypothetical protein J6W28_08855, partial [Clostridia bacterium]|nr:hypothetical protein [Clostridia bacterium]